MMFSSAGVERFERLMGGHVESGGVPGVVALVDRGGETHVTVAGEGYARDTIFRIASISKPIVAVGAMILIEECRLRLDDSVEDLLPELENRRVLKSLESAVDDTVPANRAITVRDVLTFRLGTGAVFAMPGTYPFQAAFDEQFPGMLPPKPSSLPAPDEYLRRMGVLPLLAQPGEKWLYHFGADILGVLIARAAGQPLEAFLKERVFDPLGMRDTGFYVPEEKIDRLPDMVWTNYRTGKSEVWDAGRGGEYGVMPAFPSAGGGLVSTADDLLAFSRMMLAGGKPLLSRSSVELMTTNQLTDKQLDDAAQFLGGSRGWGLGLGVTTRRTEYASVGSFGWDGGFGTSWAADPKEGLTGILLTQRMWSSPTPPAVCRDFWISAYTALAE